jgi:dihydrofolate reductase
VRDLIVTENITLDGVIDLAGGWFTPDAPHPDQMAVEQRHRDSADAVLLGRETFTQFAAYWPHQTNDRTGITAYLNRIHKYVVSSTLTDPKWKNSSVLGFDDIAALKDRPGKAIVATGSVQLVRALVGTGLVDEYRLFVYPVVAGTGARLFDQPTPPLRRTEVVGFESGVVLLTYRTR